MPQPEPRHFKEAQKIVERVAEMDEDWAAYSMVVKGAALRFLDECSLEPTPDAVDQLAEAFLPALAIMCQRGYDPNGANWRAMGWRGLLFEIHKRWKRIHVNGWKRKRFDHNNTVDAINYLGYYLRLHHDGEPWGDMGEPG